MYVSTAMRFSMGDIPFRDELMSALSQFNVLTSPLFWIFPGITLLQMRCIGIGLHIVSLFLLFIFLARYGPPLLVALLCSIMFFVNNFYGIASPSYNSLSSIFSLISLTVWLFAIAADKKAHRFFLSVLGGLFFSLAFFSYSSLVFILVIHVAVIGIAIYFCERPRIYIFSSLVFLITFGSIILTAVIIIASYGVVPDVIKGFWLAKETTILGAHGLLAKTGNLFKEFYHVAHKGFIAFAILGGAVLFSFLSGKGKKRYDFIYGCAGIILIAAIGYIFPILLSQHTHLVALTFAVPLALIMLFFRYESDTTSTGIVTWNMLQNIAIVWGFVSTLIYGMSSGMGLRACVLGTTPLFVFGMVSLYRIVNNYSALQEFGSIRRNILRAFVIITAITFFIPSVRYYYHSVYNEREIKKLTKRFQFPRLSGIYSTPEKVRVVEELLGYLKGKVKPGDYFLAYNDIPMLYFLTHTRPAYGAAWARDDWPIKIRQALVEKMIENERIPEYCVRMQAIPHGSDRNWKRGMPYDEDGPLDSFVHSNYYLETIMYPFEIWHYGQGPPFRIFDTMTPDFEDSFNTWKGPDTISMHDLSSTVAPLILQGFIGDFRFSRIQDKDGNIIRVSPIKREKNSEWVVQYGYMLNKNDFKLTLQSGSKVIFIISARLSKSVRNPPSCFIQDKTDEWERNSVIVNTTAWSQHIVSKRIRNNVKDLCLGISWRPANENDWLEIKHPRIVVAHHEG